MGPAEQVQAALVARLFFVDGHNKSDIARQLDISRFKVAEILEAAREQGIVRIEIALPSDIDADLSERLHAEYGLRHAIVVAAPDRDVPSLRDQIGSAAARLLEEICREDDVLGIGWGRTLDAMADRLEYLPGCDVVQMTGVVGSVPQTSVDLVRRIGEVAQGRAFPIFAPLFYADLETLRGILRQPAIAAAVRRFGSITTAVVAIGSWDPPDSRVYEALPPTDRAELYDLGARAELCGSLIDEHGGVLPTPLSDRTLAIDLQQLAQADQVIGVAGGASKTHAIQAVLRSGILTGLVTDADVARSLLRSDDGHKAEGGQ
jgi:DNA-binding transcriptional regulator LsrR (DeoR family)